MPFHSKGKTHIFYYLLQRDYCRSCLEFKIHELEIAGREWLPIIIQDSDISSHRFANLHL